MDTYFNVSVIFNYKCRPFLLQKIYDCVLNAYRTGNPESSVEYVFLSLSILINKENEISSEMAVMQVIGIVT